MDQYTNPKFSGAFTGQETFKRALGKVSRKKVQDYLQGNDAYTLHKPTRKPRRFRRIYSLGINYHFQADLVDMSMFSKENNGFKWILTVIDTFSKKLWAFKMKNKTAKSVLSVFKPLLIEKKPQKLETDSGTEFTNKKFQELLEANKIDHYTVSSDRKCAIVERVNRTLKTRMYRAFTAQGSRRWTNILADLVSGYNNSYHRSIKMKPNEVNKQTEEEVRENLYPPLANPSPPKLKVGDSVRITRIKNIFEKGYARSWSFEVFFVSKIKNTNPITYAIKDYKGEEIGGSFYESEVQKVDKSNDVYLVDSIVKKRTVKGKVEYLVKWKGYPDAANSWIGHADLYDL